MAIEPSCAALTTSLRPPTSSYACFRAANMQIPYSFYFTLALFSFAPLGLFARPAAPIASRSMLLFCFRSAMFSTHVVSLFISAATLSLLCIAHFTFLRKAQKGGRGVAKAAGGKKKKLTKKRQRRTPQKS